jgi:arginyl-tRNA synthetase
MTSLAGKLSKNVGQAFAANDLPSDLGVVRVSDRPDLAQFQCNGAMAAAKVAKKNPREIANTIVESLKSQMGIEHLDIAGPGFINLNVTDDFLAEHLKEIAKDPRLGIPEIGNETVVLDYGGPNVAKAMHVGHLRAAIIGDSLRRLMAFAGFKTLGDVHLGDWGTQMGMIISELEIRNPEWPYFDESFSDDYPLESPVSLEDLEEIYPAAALACKENEDRLETARKATVELQDGRKGYRALWQHFVDVSIEAIKQNYEALGVHFDLWKGEADVHEYIAPMVEALKKKDFAVEDDGALVVPVKRNDDTKEVPPLILYKRDGAVMYGTTDMGTLVERMKLYEPSKIIYIVDQRQHLHFEQVFRAAKMAGIVPDSVELTHAGFGTMNGTDGKPFKTREGGVLKLEDLISMAVEKALSRLDEAELAQDMGLDEKKEVAHKIGIAAIKFADLQNQRQSDYVFDLDRLTSFEGKTGPYLLYQAVRIKSLIKKSGLNMEELDYTFLIQEEDRSLALLLTELPDHFTTAVRNYAPHYLCEYIYKLAGAFSSFYGNCHILSEKNEDIKNSRLALCSLTYKQLEFVLGILGISIPERM